MQIDSQIVGFAATLIGVVSTLPQLIKTLRTRSTTDISLWMWLLIDISVFCWLIHGLVFTDWPIIISNSLILPSSLVITAYKLKYG